MRSRIAVVLARLATLAVVFTACQKPAAPKGASVDWPVYGGNTDHTHFTTLSQITPANVTSLKVAWTF